MKRLLLALGLPLTVALPLAACRTGGIAQKADVPPEPTVAVSTAHSEEPELKAGALMWSQNCMRCHNLRNPGERSDREWDVIVHHMRVRANLTAQEHRLITRFLQSAN